MLGHMSFARKSRFFGAILVLALLASGCVAPAPEQTPSDTESDSDVYTPRTYTVADIDSVDLVEITSDETNGGCNQWHVELVIDDATDDWQGSAWFSDQTCMDDEDTPVPDPTVVQMSAQQVTDFRAMLTSVAINTWNTWLDANPGPEPTATTDSPDFSVAVLVDNADGMYFDNISVEGTQPPGWDQFVLAMKKATGKA